MNLVHSFFWLLGTFNRIHKETTTPSPEEGTDFVPPETDRDSWKNSVKRKMASMDTDAVTTADDVCNMQKYNKATGRQGYFAYTRSKSVSKRCCNA